MIDEWIEETFRRYQPIQSRYELKQAFEILEVWKPKTIVELGVFRGGSLFVWHKAATEDAKIVGVDTPGTPEQLEADMKSWMIQSQTCKLFWGDTKSPELAKQAREFLGQDIDFLFIDAEHSYESVSKDFETWYPYVRPGGLIGFHDIWPNVSPDFHIQVWKLWGELKKKHPHWEIFAPEPPIYGLGLLNNI